MNDCLGEKPVGSLLRRGRYSLNERELTTFLSMVTVPLGARQGVIDSSADTYIRADTVLLALVKHTPGDHFCHPRYVTFVTAALSTTPTPCGPRSGGLEFPGRPEARGQVSVCRDWGVRSGQEWGWQWPKSLPEPVLGLSPGLSLPTEFLTRTSKVSHISPPCLGMLRLALSCPMAASGPGGTTRGPHLGWQETVHFLGARSQSLGTQ